ncbi:hypothetical protein [Phaeovulum sp.]|uniref:hypothetical protein n=1 Tax=Phaeovulum sp. TaxID=2934796 RepID=UPI0035627184
MRPHSQPALVALLSAALLGSFFLPVISIPLLMQITPIATLQEVGLDGLGDMGLAVQLFFASYPLAALVLLLALLRACPGVLALAAGAVPIGVTTWAAFNVNDEMQQLGLRASALDFVDFLGSGAYLYIGAALALVLIALFDRTRA